MTPTLRPVHIPWGLDGTVFYSNGLVDEDENVYLLDASGRFTIAHDTTKYIRLGRLKYFPVAVEG